jgi:hypothetical protein
MTRPGRVQLVLAAIGTSLAVVSYPDDRASVAVSLAPVPGSDLVWVGLQNTSGKVGAVCVENGSLKIESAGGVMGRDLLPMLSHGAHCDSMDGWHLVQPGERYYFGALYSQADASQASMTVSLKVRFGSIKDFTEHSKPNYLEGTALLPPIR